MTRAYWGSIEQNDTASQLAVYHKLFSEPPPYVAIDTETISLKDRTVLGVGFALPGNHNFYFDLTDPGFPWHLLLPSSIRKIWHNATFDLSHEVLGKFGADIDNIEDTAIITRLLNIPTGLSEAALWTTARTWTVKELLAKHKVKDMHKLPWIVVAMKCIQDARVTLLLYEQYKSQVDAEYYEVERKITSMLLYMSHRGIKLDQALVALIEGELRQDVDFHVGLCKQLGFNPFAPKQVGIALTHQGIMLPWKRGAKQPSTDKEALKNIDPPHTWAAETLLARKYNKLHNVVKPLLNADRAYSHFHLDAATGRISSEDIQLHNLPTGKRLGDIIPKAGPIRRVFIPDAELDTLDEEIFTIFDQSQVELRVVAWLSGDKVLQAAIDSPERDASGKLLGVHGVTQRALGIYSRVMTKNFIFGTLYGGSVEVLAQFTGIRDRAVLLHYQQKIAALYPVMWAWLQNQRAIGLHDGYITTMYGRKLSLDLAMMQGERHAGNCAVNYPIQGGATEIFKRVLIALAATVPIKDFILQVHDEQLLNGKHDVHPDELAHISPVHTPLEVNYVKRWQ
tara:strand:- start:93 stop:1790 length:1698 start_codon:yes stop_codon:yes gene_type:complete